jgi:hypothetical protein
MTRAEIATTCVAASLIAGLAFAAGQHSAERETAAALRDLARRVATLVPPAAAPCREPRSADAAVAGAGEAEPAPSAAEATKIVDDAELRGVWSEADAMHLRGMMPQLSNAQGDALRRRLVVLINDGKVKLAYKGSPF